ncbi:MAG TPA: FAD binding domain-containing protein, partial [Terriglobales bacterium]|nr:FAD binding domain-containing protein [Terriglobales bacterium]
MRSNPAEFEFVTPTSLTEAVKLLADHKQQWIPIAGGTDLMVQFAAGTLAPRQLLSIWNLPELRRIEVLRGEVQVGAGCTYTDLREHATIAQEFP